MGSRDAAAGSTMDFSLGAFKASILFAGLPSAAANTNVMKVVTDCATAACSAGGGTVRAIKISDGSVWNTISGTPITVPGSSGDILYNNGGILGARSPNGTGTKVQMGTGGPYTVSGLLGMFDADGNLIGAGDPTNCSTRQATTGVNSFGNADGCFSTSVFSGSTALTSAFSATPTFDIGDSGGKSPKCFEPGAMTANVTSVTFTNKTAGAEFCIVWVEGGAGNFTLTHGVSASNTCAVVGAAGYTLTQRYKVSADGSTVKGIGCAVDGVDYIDVTVIAAPATPPTGAGRLYVDSTSKNIAIKDDAGVVKHGVKTDTGTANNYISAIADDGTITKSRPSCATLSDSGAGCSGSSTSSSGPQWLFGMPSYAPGPAGLLVNGGAANKGSIFMPTTLAGTSTSTSLVYNVAVVGAGGAGILFAYYNSAMTAPVCVTTVGTGTNVTALGGHILTWASGSGVSGGTCTRPAGSPLVVTSDDTSIKLIAYYDQAATDTIRLFNADLVSASTGNIYAAQTGSSISSGTGGSLAFTTNLSAITWSSFGATSSSTVPVMAQN